MLPCCASTRDRRPNKGSAVVVERRLLLLLLLDTGMWLKLERRAYRRWVMGHEFVVADDDDDDEP